ncbi:MAG: molybdenum cofactor carrier [Rhodospirillales bacterium]|nr:molybdenum cofactor carrier [Rhodospirillales bacterium]
MVLVSGGQTGADQGALEAARACGIPITGWCPGGRWTEAGPLSRCWPLTPTPLRRPIQRTHRNLRLADGVLILAGHRLRGGSVVLPRTAGASRPRLVLDPRSSRAVPAATRFCRRHRIRLLLVGGPRESQEPGIRIAVRDMMTRFYRALAPAASLPLDRAGRF